MIKAASLPIDTNLLSFSKLLSAQGLAHRINEESGEQVLWVGTEAEADFVKSALEQWLKEDHSQLDNELAALSSSRNVSNDLRGLINSMFAAVYYYPVTAALFSGCLLVALISGLGAYPERVAPLFYPYVSSDGLFLLLVDLIHPLKLLQSLTPMFLHFGELHLIFNMLWLWYFGRQLESIHSTAGFIGLVLTISFASNTTQYMLNDANNFGGMSGVVYGLVGYSWVVHKLMPRSYLVLSPNMLGFFILALVAMEVIASSLVATGAHVGGLVSGVVLGGAVVSINRLLLNKSAVGCPPIRR